MRLASRRRRRSLWLGLPATPPLRPPSLAGAVPVTGRLCWKRNSSVKQVKPCFTDYQPRGLSKRILSLKIFESFENLNFLNVFLLNVCHFDILEKKVSVTSAKKPSKLMIFA